MASFSSPDRGHNPAQAPLAPLSLRNYSRPTMSSASLVPIHPQSLFRTSRHVILEPRPHNEYPDFLTSRGKATISHHDENMRGGTVLVVGWGEAVNRADPYCASKEKPHLRLQFHLPPLKVHIMRTEDTASQRILQATTHPRSKWTPKDYRLV